MANLASLEGPLTPIEYTTGAKSLEHKTLFLLVAVIACETNCHHLHIIPCQECLGVGDIRTKAKSADEELQIQWPDHFSQTPFEHFPWIFMLRAGILVELRAVNAQ
jgi:hypothetical protein